jgi:CBS domain-containing protein
MKVRDVMKTPVITVSPATSYEETARLLNESHFSGVPIVSDSGKLLGIVSEKDLFRAMYPRYEEYVFEPHAYLDQEVQEGEVKTIRKQPIEKFMETNVVTIEADAPILHAGGLMLAHGFHRLPVTDKGVLVGIVTREDIYSAIFKKYLL